jgi:PAS domain S-box-containing protein
MIDFFLEHQWFKAFPQEQMSKLRQSELVLDLARAISRAQGSSELYRTATRGIVQVFAADRAAVLIFDQNDVLRFKEWVGLSDEYCKAVNGHTPWKRGAPDAHPIAVSDVVQCSSISPYLQTLANEGIRAVALIPLMGSSGAVGTIFLGYNSPHEFETDELQVAQAIAADVAHATERQRSEIAWRESEERFLATFQQAAVGITQTGLDGKWQLVNDRYCEILGYTQAELRGKTFLDVTHPDDHQASLVAIRRLLAGEISSHSLEKRCIRKDGTIVWVRRSAALVRDRENLPQYFISMVEDITERMNAERELRDSEQRLMLAKRAAHLGVCEWDLSTNVFSHSEEYNLLYGLAPDHPQLTLEELGERTHPDDRERVQVSIRDALERTHAWDTEYRVVWPDGSVHWLHSRGAVFLDASGQPFRTTGVVLDITEGKRREQALRESEECFRRVFEDGPLGLALVGMDYRFLKVNHALCHMVGYSEAELLQASFIDITHPDDLRADVELAEQLFRREIPFYQLRKRYQKKNGDIIWINLTASLIRDREGRPIHGLAMIEDITEAKRVQEEALARQKLESVGVLAGGIAHDFNNLLGGILAEAELMEADLPAGSRSGEEIQRIKADAIRGTQIVRELMIYAGNDPTSLVAPVNLSGLVQEMLELIKASISTHAILKTDLQELPVMLGNVSQIRQVVMNLIINASEAIGESNGIITVATSLVSGGLDLSSNSPVNLPDGDCLLLMVTDTGCGMTEEVQGKIFDPFFTTKFPGRGLGLAVVQGITRAHGGAINLVSAPGRGTTVRILLPFAPLPVLPARIAPTPS